LIGPGKEQLFQSGVLGDISDQPESAHGMAEDCGVAESSPDESDDADAAEAHHHHVQNAA
jgi:hypothetical protein